MTEMQARRILWAAPEPEHAYWRFEWLASRVHLDTYPLQQWRFAFQACRDRPLERSAVPLARSLRDRQIEASIMRVGRRTDAEIWQTREDARSRVLPVLGKRALDTDRNCHACKSLLPIDDFYWQAASRSHSWTCRPCSIASSRIRNAERRRRSV